MGKSIKKYIETGTKYKPINFELEDIGDLQRQIDCGEQIHAVIIGENPKRFKIGRLYKNQKLGLLKVEDRLVIERVTDIPWWDTLPEYVQAIIKKRLHKGVQWVILSWAG
jgi:hypothetical protein